MIKPKRVLVVDDNADAADSLAALLRVVGHEVQTARDGLQALLAAEQHRPHLLLLDISLPQMDGHEVCRRIRAEPWGQDMIIAAVTGWSREEDRRRSREAGFDTHFVKPLSPDSLHQLLR